MNLAVRLEFRAQTARGHRVVHSDLKPGRERVALAQSLPDARVARFQRVHNRGHGVAFSNDLGETIRQIAHLHWNEDCRHKQLG